MAGCTCIRILVVLHLATHVWNVSTTEKVRCFNGGTCIAITEVPCLFCVCPPLFSGRFCQDLIFRGPHLNDSNVSSKVAPLPLLKNFQNLTDADESLDKSQESGDKKESGIVTTTSNIFINETSTMSTNLNFLAALKFPNTRLIVLEERPCMSFMTWRNLSIPPLFCMENGDRCILTAVNSVGIRTCKRGFAFQASGCCEPCHLQCYNASCIAVQGRSRCKCPNGFFFEDDIGCVPACQINPLDKACPPINDRETHIAWIGLGITLGLLLILGLIFSAVLYLLWRRRALFALKLVRTFQPYEDSEDKTHDVFLSYKGFAEEEGWVENELFARLEQDWGYKVIIHVRDFRPGKEIVENIHEAVRNSRRIIVVLSRSYLTSEWCRYELLSAHQEMIRMKARVVPILFEDVNKEKGLLTGGIKSLLQSVTYIEWPGFPDTAEKEAKVDHFWKMLRYAMPKLRNSEIYNDEKKKPMKKRFSFLNFFKSQSVTRGILSLVSRISWKPKSNEAKAIPAFSNSLCKSNVPNVSPTCSMVLPINDTVMKASHSEGVDIDLSANISITPFIENVSIRHSSATKKNADKSSLGS